MLRIVPCPYCGATAKVLIHNESNTYGVYCEDDIKSQRPHGHFINNFLTADDAIRAWNRSVIPIWCNEDSECLDGQCPYYKESSCELIDMKLI